MLTGVLARLHREVQGTAMNTPAQAEILFSRVCGGVVQ